jgi:DNA adenine methylase
MITNFLRYPGSKRRMLGFLSQHIPTNTALRGRYVEPFVGSGAVFFMLDPKQALLSDINPDLIDLYRGIQRSPEAVWDRYCAFGSSKDEYQRIRDAASPELLVGRAARVLFLNRTCFKGMWRHNQEGKFNVGYGGQDRRWVIGLDNLVTVAHALRGVELRCCDFEEVVGECQAGDFIFVDPPYLPGGKELNNDHYVGCQFSFEDHRRLASVLQSAKERGVQWALTTSAHPDIVILFSGNRVILIPRGTGRKPGTTVANSGEVLITSYHTRGGLGQ